MTRNEILNTVFNIEKSVFSLTTDKYLDTIIRYVIDFLNINKYKGIQRGFIDLCGMFKDYNNYDIAFKILNFYCDKKIIYFKGNEPYKLYLKEGKIICEIYDNSIDNQNFYYYDNAHTVGSDLK